MWLYRVAVMTAIFFKLIQLKNNNNIHRIKNGHC